MNLRKHQSDLSKIIDRIISGDPVRTIICRVTPGGGKSALPIIAGRLIAAGLADGICWVCPRRSLQYQGERNFQDPFFREAIGHRLSVRASTNEPDPCRGLNGFITTYQAIGLDEAGTVLEAFRRRRFILVCDEFHHVELDGVWHKALAPIAEAAKYVLLLSGTLERGDGKQIAFTPYLPNRIGHIPFLRNTTDTRIIEYSRSDALQERAIIPLKFFLNDGHAEWQDEGGNTVNMSLSKSGHEASRAIYTALSTEYAEDLLGLAFDHWIKHRQAVPTSKLLVVTASLQHAKAAVEWMKGRWAASEIATSHESDAAHEAIKRFKDGGLDILVSIAMASEGLDVPEVDHMAILTHIRSTPWIEQCVCRAVRINRAAGPWEDQCGFIFAPDDPLFREIVRKIEAEQLPIARKSRALAGDGEQLELFDEPKKDGEKRLNFIPLSSRLTGRRELSLGGNGGGVAPVYQMPLPKTPSEIEQELRDQIEEHVRAYSFRNRKTPYDLNKALFDRYQKPRAEMTTPELEMVLRYLRQSYPQTYTRGTGRQRVPTKAKAVEVEWDQREAERFYL